MFRLLVTGSRDWGDAEFIRRELAEALAAFGLNAGGWPTLIHGGNGLKRDGKLLKYCHPRSQEADAIADRWWRSWGYPVHVHWADWSELGRAAGPTRNREMVRDSRADLCLAFIRDGSAGATGCANEANRHGIPVRIFRLSTSVVTR